MVSERSLAILRAIVEDYIATSEPVGSKAIVERHDFGVSAATVRNDMALLEDEELISAPHTSSGRVPTDKGYRVFVDQLSELRPLSPAQRQAIERFLGESEDPSQLFARTTRVLSQLTGQLALIADPNSNQLLVSGAANLVRTENDFAGHIVSVLDAIDEQVIVLRLLAETARESDVAVSIGRENEQYGLHSSSIVSAGFGEAGVRRVGVLGPTRMNYTSNIVAVRAVARYLSQLLGDRSN
ncbi:MAG TPA: hypothetical protein VK139_03890 [Microbacteriaceae bacterium]|nr:hypothetical protein [Microbacteriaceae bacterium]